MAGVGQCASLKVRNVAGVGQCASLKVRKCANPPFLESIGVRGVARASGVRRCVRSGCGAVAARGP